MKLATFALLFLSSVLLLACGRPHATSVTSPSEVPKAKDVSLPDSTMSWVDPSPIVILVNQQGGKPLEICVGVARVSKAGEAVGVMIVGGAIKNGKIPTASEAAADTSLSGIVKVTEIEEYLAWKERTK